MDYDLISKVSLEELKNYLRIRGLKVNGRKNELVVRAFAASENCIKPIKTAVEVEADLKTEYLAKLKIDDRNIPDPFKIPRGWMKEDESMKFWPMLLYPDIFKYLMFFPSESGNKDLNDYKNSKAYSYHKSGWLQPLLYHNLSGSQTRLHEPLQHLKWSSLLQLTKRGVLDNIFSNQDLSTRYSIKS